MRKTTSYELLKDLPMYPAGTIINHSFEELPSQYLDKNGNKQTYFTDGEWLVDGIRATQYLEAIVKWCSTSQRQDDDHTSWVQIVGETES